LLKSQHLGASWSRNIPGAEQYHVESSGDERVFSVFRVFGDLRCGFRVFAVLFWTVEFVAGIYIILTNAGAGPAVSSNALLPVMVWIHGGALRSNSSFASGMFDGQEYVERGVVFSCYRRKACYTAPPPRANLGLL